ncbi:hypothetical protein OOT46_17995 [Aquabacterium sp. A7-Y]|uniref:hotdog domain-containing protein n=1 Tax=Aquabacterium sp. A7-Y TaxID=1349605 RepID=UPI00223E33B0|nr:hotdog domain-containing protein [Aquabacterium sp. A7-Y]MCW7539732.1 hypothetical protein [Aquabacterium sp. A7-Y]
MSLPLQQRADYRLSLPQRERALRLFNQRSELLWFGFRGRFDADGVAAISLEQLHEGVRGGGGTGAVNGGVIAAGFDAVSVLSGLGQYETDVVVTLELSVQFLSLARTEFAPEFRGWVTRSSRTLSFVQGTLEGGGRVFATASAMVMPVFAAAS